ncbi:MTH1187 family thiamine-binding protein [Methanobacterium sp. ACI-7]|uniref:MTH1187 family thiamine-binding protein n=1 Tax=unclassified Methanobacterium TaxID=2627676 RepID=UPI0039C1DC84
MITAELTVIPIGTGDTSISEYIAAAVSILEERGIKYEINGVGTLIETEDSQKLFDAVKAVHEAVFNEGAKRVSTHLKIDDRRDSEKTMEQKVESVEKKL